MDQLWSAFIWSCLSNIDRSVADSLCALSILLFPEDQI
jgi:hypothetical protein